MQGGSSYSRDPCMIAVELSCTSSDYLITAVLGKARLGLAAGLWLSMVARASLPLKTPSVKPQVAYNPVLI